MTNPIILYRAGESGKKIGSFDASGGIDAIVAHPQVLPLFRSHVAGNTSAVNTLDFIIALKDQKDPVEIVQTFIEPGAKRQINVSGANLWEFKSLFKNPDAGMADMPGFGPPGEEEPLDGGSIQGGVDLDGSVDDFATLMAEGDAQDTTELDLKDPQLFQAIRLDAGNFLVANYVSIFYSSDSPFMDYCYSVIGKPDAFATQLGLRDKADVEMFGIFRIAVTMKNRRVISEVGPELAKTLHIDLKQLVLTTNSKIEQRTAEKSSEASDWKKKIWENGTFEIAVKQFVEAQVAGQKKGMAASLDTAHSVASISLNMPSLTKKMILDEILSYAKNRAKTTGGGQQDGADAARAKKDIQPHLDISLVTQVKWQEFLKIYGLEPEDEKEVRKLAQIYVKHGKDEARTLSQSLFNKQKKRKSRSFRFANAEHVEAALANTLELKQNGKNLKKPVKASQAKGFDDAEE
ncbi:hypothetical protein [uncultured Tateyamaria sp.]|uniref:hypothetical protein n=1 Tax=uncultured Tateyamaria sp. TaxID=455651 RepID=UPI002634CE51|nr:hypothetical protein [uncultured Tateyamaria sp.]